MAQHNLNDDDTTRVQTTLVCRDPERGVIDLPLTDLQPRHDIKAIVFTIYRGDNYTAGPPFETRIFRNKDDITLSETCWSWDDANMAHLNTVWDTMQRAKAQ
jgi:hypothetical protein